MWFDRVCTLSVLLGSRLRQNSNGVERWKETIKIGNQRFKAKDQTPIYQYITDRKDEDNEIDWQFSKFAWLAWIISSSSPKFTRVHQVSTLWTSPASESLTLSICNLGDLDWNFEMISPTVLASLFSVWIWIWKHSSYIESYVSCPYRPSEHSNCQNPIKTLQTL